MKLVEVTWYDTHASGGGWRTVKEILHAGAASYYHCRSTGYLLYSDTRVVVLCQSLTEDGRATDTVTIPKGCVKRIRSLR